MIGLVDCNNFFVSCERVFRPELLGRPVIVLSNNDGCAVALSNEAKALGIRRGDPLFKIRETVEREHVEVFSSNFRLYGDMSARVMTTLRSVAESIEVYSIDEAFLHLGDDHNRLDVYGRDVAHLVRKNVGIPVSVGIAPTKTLAKIASRFAKKYPGYRGCCVVDSTAKAEKAMSLTEVGDVWGVGRRNAKRLLSRGIKTALDFARMSQSEVRALFTVVGERTWRELNGEPCVVDEPVPADHKTITSSHSFERALYQLDQLRRSMAAFATTVGHRLREQGLYAVEVQAFVATNRFSQYEPYYANAARCLLDEPTQDTTKILRAALAALDQVYLPRLGYKKAGIIVSRVAGSRGVQPSLFTDMSDFEKRQRLMRTLDSVNHRIDGAGVHLASLGSGLADMVRREHASRLYSTRLSDIITINCKD